MKCSVATAPVVGLTLASLFAALFAAPFEAPFAAQVAAQVAAPSAAEVIVFRNVAAFDGSQLIRRTNVLVRDGMIRAVGPDTSIPPSAQIIEGEGRTLLPGLIDAHTHLGVYNAEQFLQDALIFGVTTELEMWGGDATRALRRDDSDRNRADLRTAGTGVTVPKGHPTQMGGPPIPTLGPEDDEQQFVDARIAEGSDYIKIIYDHAFPTLTTKQLAAVVNAAHRRKKLVVAHVLTQSDARDAITAGVDGLVHIFADSPPAPDVIDMAAKRGVFVIATLSVTEVLTKRPDTPNAPTTSEAPTTSNAPNTSDAPWWQSAQLVMSRITPSMKRSLEMKRSTAFASKLSLAHAQSVVAALHRAGVPILAGTDAPAPGLAHGVSLHRELELLVLSGLTPTQALASATSITARAFGLNDRGRIAPGLRADLLLVNGDPTTDIRATRDIAGVWKLGTTRSPDKSTTER